LFCKNLKNKGLRSKQRIGRASRESLSVPSKYSRKTTNMIKRKDYELNMMWQAATKDKSSKSKNELTY